MAVDKRARLQEDGVNDPMVEGERVEIRGIRFEVKKVNYLRIECPLSIPGTDLEMLACRIDGLDREQAIKRVEEYIDAHPGIVMRD